MPQQDHHHPQLGRSGGDSVVEGAQVPDPLQSTLERFPLQGLPEHIAKRKLRVRIE
jgi:hypothetical protein